MIGKAGSPGFWAFLVTAAAAPLLYAGSLPCGRGCALWPGGGACIAMVPLAGGILFIQKFYRRILRFFSPD